MSNPVSPEADELEAMRAAVAESDADYEAGRYTVHTAETTPQLLEALKREARDPAEYPE